jgi:hypothetical protein
LKDVRSALRAVGAPLDVTPEMGSLEAALGRAGVV